MKKNGETKMRFLKVAKAPFIGERIDGETRVPVYYGLEAFLDEYVWVDDRWSTGTDGNDAEAWALAFDRLTDLLVPERTADGPGKLEEGAELALEPEDWLKLRLVATSVSRIENGVRVSGVDPRIARVVRKAHQNAIILARSGPAPKAAPIETEEDEDDEEATAAPS